MRLFLSGVLGGLALLPMPVRADVTIRYKMETSNPMTPAASWSTSSVIYMKGNKGATVGEGETVLVDLGREQVTLIDTVRRKYATIPAAEYGTRMGKEMAAQMPQAPGVAEMLKTMKTTCETKQAEAMEVIQGVQAQERDVNCTMTMAMPASVAATMPAMSMKFSLRMWSASPSERLRVPGLWQLSGFELWQKYFMNPGAGLGKLAPEGLTTMVEAMRTDQSATLRTSMEMSMKMPFPGTGGGDTPLMKMNTEVVGITTELLDDSLFAVPGDCSAEPFDDLVRAVGAAAVASAKTKMDAAQPVVPKAVIPENIKAFLPAYSLAALTEPEAAAPTDAGGQKLQGMVDLLITVGPKGNVLQAEVLYGPELLRQAAIDGVMRRTYRPVIRNGVPVTAYTETTVDFADFSKGPPPTPSFEMTPEMKAAGERLQQLEEAFPRSPEQELADLEQDAGGDVPLRRYYRLGDMALKAVQLGAVDKAKTYATELLAGAQANSADWNYGNAIHGGHSVLGVVALRSGDIETAREQLLEAGKTPGSPQLDSFGPNMLLAEELLKKGERNTVLDYFELCRKFWKTGGAQLDAMSKTVREGGMPMFDTDLPQ